MPKTTTHLTLARQWELLQLLPGRAPGKTARELTSDLKDAGYEVSKRTVERDLNELSRQFGIACNADSMPYGWHWLPGGKQELGSLGVADAVSLSVAEGVLRQMLPPSMLQVLQPKFDLAKSKLAAASGHPVAKLNQKVRYVPSSLQLRAPQIQPKVMEAVQQALVSERQILVRYAPFQAKAKELRLHPLSLVQRGNVCYLLASAFDYPEVLIYAVHRIEQIELLAEAIRPPDGFSLEAQIESGQFDFGGGAEITFKAKLSDALATYLSETPIAAGQEIKYRAGGYQLQAAVRDSWQLQFWILSQGAEIEVVSPKSLRARIHAKLAAAAGRYESIK